jgi:ribosomal protein S27AE
MTPESAAEAVKMYEAGIAIGPIASYFQVSRQGMWDLLRRRTKMRPQQKLGADNHFHRGGRNWDARVHDLMEYALQKGILVRKDKCESCGDSGKARDGRSIIQGHHKDYNKPLEVTWLCQKCHYAWHLKNKPIKKDYQ